jgi:hypothetical protein
MSKIFAFCSADEEFYQYDDEEMKNGYIYSIYNPETDSNRVPESTEKMNKAARVIDPDNYERREDDCWIRLDYESIIEGEPERVER